MVTEGPLKTKNSYRKIVVPSDVMAVLKDKQKKDNGTSEYVFATVPPHRRSASAA